MLPNYVITNGGQINLAFTTADTYVNPVYNPQTSTYDYPTTLHIFDNNNNALDNYIVNDGLQPSSILQIVINICGTTFCPSFINITGLRKALNPLSNCMQTITVTTSSGDDIASSSFTVMQYNPTKITNTLILALSNSVATQTSNYNFNFISSKIPFQSNLIISFTSMITINGGCFVVHNSSILGYVLNCGVVNSSSIVLTYSGDPTLMMIDIISYQITITNVTNPSNIMPLTYSITTSFNNVLNQQFSTTYAIQSPFPLTLTYLKKNNTLAQTTTMTISIISSYPNFDQASLSIPTSLLTLQQSPNYQYSILNNNYNVNGIYALNNNSVTLNIINPSSTSATNTAILSLSIAGYLSAQGSVGIGAVAPVYLGLSISIKNQTVGAANELTINFLRVNPLAA